jgi:hypothetical protein
MTMKNLHNWKDGSTLHYNQKLLLLPLTEDKIPKGYAGFTASFHFYAHL